MRFLEKMIASKPIVLIEWVLAVSTLIGGLYMFTPLYRISIASNGLTGMAATFSSPSMIFIWAFVLTVGAILAIYGIVRRLPHYKSVGWFSIFLARLYQVLSALLATGFLPVTWLYPLTLGLVVLILWGIARVEVNRHAAP